VRPAFGFAIRRAVDGDIGIELVGGGTVALGGGGGATRRGGSCVIFVFIGGGSTVTSRDGMKSRSGDSTQNPAIRAPRVPSITHTFKYERHATSINNLPESERFD